MSQCCHGVISVWSQCYHNVVTVLSQYCHSIVTVWSQYCYRVVASSCTVGHVVAVSSMMSKVSVMLCYQEEEDDSAAGAVDRPAGAVGGGSAQDEESRVGNVRSSIGSVMTAMRDLLSNIGLTPAEEETRSDGEYEASEGEEYFSQQDWD